MNLTYFPTNPPNTPHSVLFSSKNWTGTDRSSGVKMSQYKNCVVLGGLGGIGSCIVDALLAKDVEKLAILDLPVELTDTFRENSKITYFQCNIADKSDLQLKLHSAWTHFEGFDLIVNSAGISNELEPEKTFAVNALGLIDFTLIGAEFMRKDTALFEPAGSGGTIVNVVSTLGFLPYQGYPIYVATKHAALGFLKSIADPELCEQTGLRFISICPGYTDTNFVAVRHRHPFSSKEQDEPLLPQPPQVVADCLVRALECPKTKSFWRCVDGRIDEIELLNGCTVVEEQ